jgi:tetratricopeptide (TPR) repeat protein
MDAESAYLFRHGVLRDAAYELMPPSLRVTLHGLVADCLAELFKERLDPVAGGIADHLELAGRLVDELPYRRRAAKYAEHNYANAEAVRNLYRIAQAEGLDAAARVRALEQAGGLQIQMGDPAGVAETLRRMDALAGDDELLALTRRGLQAKLDMRAGRTSEAGEAYEQLAEAWRRRGNRERELVVLGGLNDVRKTQGRFDEAEALCKRVLELAVELGDRRQECRTLSHLATTYGYKQQYKLAEDYCRRALKLAQDLHERQIEGGVLNTLALVLRREGRLEEALQTYRQALAVLRETGARVHEGVALGNMGAVLEDLGRRDESGRLFKQAIEVHRRTGNRRFEGIHTGALAVHAERDGRREEAERLMADAIAILDEVGDARIAEQFRQTRAGWE